MTDYEIYVFLLCFIVFAMFVLLFSYVLTLLMKMRLKMIRYGLEDEKIITEHQKQQNRSKAGRAASIATSVLSLLISLAFLSAFAFSFYLNVTESKAPNGIPSLKVVKSSSMASVHEENTYITENGLTDQFEVFDIIVTHHLPPEDELELYDIVVYKKDDFYIIHRIVGIEEPDQEHPDCRHFLLQGDAVSNPDQFPVLYSQMQGIYRGERIPFAGSFVLFMQSPAGWLCIILILFAIIVSPILDKKLAKASKARLFKIEHTETKEEEE